MDIAFRVFQVDEVVIIQVDNLYYVLRSLLEKQAEEVKKESDPGD